MLVNSVSLLGVSAQGICASAFLDPAESFAAMIQGRLGDVSEETESGQLLQQMIQGVPRSAPLYKIRDVSQLAQVRTVRDLLRDGFSLERVLRTFYLWAHDLDPLITSLRQSATQIAAAQALADNTISLASLKSFINFHPDHFTRNWIWWQPEFEILMHCWRPGQVSTIHDHVDSTGFDVVLDGCLWEDLFEERPNGKLRLVDQRIIRAGEAGLMRRKSIHRMINPGMYQQNAISLHIYFEPIDLTMVNTWPEEVVEA